MLLHHNFIAWITKNFLENDFYLSLKFTPTEMLSFFNGTAENLRRRKFQGSLRSWVIM